MNRPHLVFIATLVVIGPAIAIAAVTTGGRWAPAGVASSGAAVSLTAFRSFLELRGRADSMASIIRLRMMGVTATVSVATGGLAAGSLVWLLAEAVG